MKDTSSDKEKTPDQPGYRYAQLQKEPTPQDAIDYLEKGELARLSVAPEPSFKPDTLIIWLEKERNLLQNTGSMMWHKPDEQRKTLEVAKALDITLQYIKESELRKKENN